MVSRSCALSMLLEGYVQVDAASDREIQGLSMDSRKTRPGDLFLACAGQSQRGHDYIAAAIRAGAVAVAYEVDGEAAAPPLPEHIPLFGVAELRQRAGFIAERFYGNPTRKLFVAGVTGTNGKTSCSQFLAQALNENAPCGVIGTLGNGLSGRLEAGTHTTPDAISLHALLADMLEKDAESVVMEVSSHGLEQGRVNGVAFDMAIFTNLSRDHLDYHGDMASYARAKRRLFEMPGLRYAVINADDLFGSELLQSMPSSVKTISYSLAGYAKGDEGGIPSRQTATKMNRVHGRVLHQDLHGLEIHVITPWGEGRFPSRLLGRFNASNLLAVLAALVLSGIDFLDALHKVSRIRPVAGRMECFGGKDGKPLVVVDYAHSPDALRQVLQALREHCRGALWVVFGCGGDRDRGKRPLMGEVAQRYADHVVLTDDNPRHEDADGIIAEIAAGLHEPGHVHVQRDRARAIAHVLKQAKEHDVVLVAGKGHEDYQIIGDDKRPFSDSAHVRALLGEGAE
ncbi:MAG: UDP-N-acetylmuramoyl-L-alanyl-D-glutamate--2,6-diaminopimelate ligase [Gammaproteobacteria bacterium]